MGFDLNAWKRHGQMLAVLAAAVLISGCGGTLDETPPVAGSPAGL